MVSIYKERFENLSRVAGRITSSLNIGDILEMIRNEAKVTIPHTKEACLLIMDPDASSYCRPLHCGVYKDRLNCQDCKRGKKSIQKALHQPSEIQCAFYENLEKCQTCKLGLSTQGIRMESPEPENMSGPDSKKAPSKNDKTSPCDIALPIYDGEEPLAVLELIAEEGHCFNEKDGILLKDLTGLATNAIVNARRHWKMAQEQLTMNRVLEHLRPFVPDTVQRIVDKDPSAPPFEKKEMDVSILFLDVAGYTKISESLTQEQVNFIIEKYFSAFLDIIASYDGDINETAGDGLMVIFQGKPQENALNAVKAALDIHKRTGEINHELKGRFQPVEINMGINSGAASVGMTRFMGASSTRMTFTATGPVTNIAARIAASAKKGDILVGPHTAERIEDQVTSYDCGLKTFKNVEKEIRVFSLIQSC